MNLKKLFIAAISLSFLFAAPLFAATADIEQSGTIEFPDIVKVGENLSVTKDMSVNNAVAIGGTVGVAGEVLNDVVAVGGSVVLKPTARVHGNVVSVGGIIRRDPDAKVAGTIKEVAMPQSLCSVAAISSKIGPNALIIAQLFASLLTFLGLLALGIAAGFLFPKRVGWISVAAEKNPLKAFMWGLLWIVLTLPIAILLAVSVIGIPLIILEFVVYGVALVLGYIAISQVLGKKLLASLRRFNQPMVTEIIWGIILLTLIGLVPVVGPLVNMIVGTMAIGAGWMSRLGEG